MRAPDPAHVVEHLEVHGLARRARPVDERAGEDAAGAADLVRLGVLGVGEVEHVAREAERHLVEQVGPERRLEAHRAALLVGQAHAGRPAQGARGRVDDVVDEVVAEGGAVPREEGMPLVEVVVDARGQGVDGGLAR